MTEAGGRNVSIPLSWNNPPKGTRSFAIETVDMHPVAQEWVHWFVVDIPPETGEVAEGASGSAMPKGARELGNGFGATGWGGPAPPPGTGVHEYRTTVYALDTPTVDVPQNATIDEYRAAVVPRALATAQISGTFER